MNIHIATISDADRELNFITDVSLFEEPESWRLIISDKIGYRQVNGPDSLEFVRLEILLVNGYFDRFTAGDLIFLLNGVGVARCFKPKELIKKIPMLKDGEQTVPEIYYDVFLDRNKDKWISFGIKDRIERRGQIAESMYRIEKMEQILDELDSRMSAIGNKSLTEAQIEDYLSFQDEVQELEKYYTGPEWKVDLELDDKGEFPSYLKRGVLSEDGVYNALVNNDEILNELL